MAPRSTKETILPPFVKVVIGTGAILLLDQLIYSFTGLSLLHTQTTQEDKRIVKRESKLKNQVRTMLKEISGREWVSVRPAWLKNPRNGRCLELDFWNEDLNIAVEVQGQQHYQYCPMWHPGGQKDFQELLFRDQYKARQCELRGVKLIKVPYTLYGKREKMREFLSKELFSRK